MCCLDIDRNTAMVHLNTNGLCHTPRCLRFTKCNLPLDRWRRLSYPNPIYIYILSGIKYDRRHSECWSRNVTGGDATPTVSWRQHEQAQRGGRGAGGGRGGALEHARVHAQHALDAQRRPAARLQSSFYDAMQANATNR